MFSELTAGDSTTWTSTYADYSASSGWAVSAIFRNLNGEKITIAGSGAAAVWTFTVTAQVSSRFSVGSWDYYIVATKTTERETVETGTVWIDANPDAADTLEGLKAQIAKVESLINGRFEDGAIESFSIRGQSVNRLGMAGLQALLSELKSRLKLLRATELERRGEHGFTSCIRFVPQ